MRRRFTGAFKSQPFIQPATRVHFQNMQSDRKVLFISIEQKLSDQVRPDALVLKLRGDLDGCEKNLISRALDGDASDRTTFIFDHLQACRIEILIEPLSLPVVVPPPRPLDIVAHGFPM